MLLPAVRPDARASKGVLGDGLRGIDASSDFSDRAALHRRADVRAPANLEGGAGQVAQQARFRDWRRREGRGEVHGHGRGHSALSVQVLQGLHPREPDDAARQVRVPFRRFVGSDRRGRAEDDEGAALPELSGALAGYARHHQRAARCAGHLRVREAEARAAPGGLQQQAPRQAAAGHANPGGRVHAHHPEAGPVGRRQNPHREPAARRGHARARNGARRPLRERLRRRPRLREEARPRSFRPCHAQNHLQSAQDNAFRNRLPKAEDSERRVKKDISKLLLLFVCLFVCLFICLFILIHLLK